MNAPFHFEPLAPTHGRTDFACGEEALDRYFQAQVTQDIRRHITNCFVAIESETGQIAAYYTIAAASIPLIEIPAEVAKRLPRYPTLPAVRIGRLAVDRRFHGRGIGAALLADAARKTLEAPPAAFALVVDAKNSQAVAFYQHHGFLQFKNQPSTLFLPPRHRREGPAANMKLMPRTTL